MIVNEYDENYGFGWVKVYRSLAKKGYYKKSDYVHLWIHILMKANHKQNTWFYKNSEMKVNPGQFITSRKSLSDETGINESKIERILKCFEIEQQIEQQNLHTSRLLSVLNYQQYQISEQQIEQQVNSKRTASEQRVNTNKNDKNKKNDKNVIPPTIEMVKKYATTRGSKVDIERFCDFYASKNWMVGKNKMKDWQAAYRTWEPKEKAEIKDPFLKF